MKTSDIYSGISIMLLFFMAFLPHEVILAQDQNTIPVKQQDKWTFNLPQHCLTLPLFDTVRPTLNNYGKGLLYYDCILLQHQDKTYLFKYRGAEIPVMMKAAFTEMELETLKENMLFIEKEYQFQIKEWIRKDKLDLNLGEAIKGFYMKPMF